MPKEGHDAEPRIEVGQRATECSTRVTQSLAKPRSILKSTFSSLSRWTNVQGIAWVGSLRNPEVLQIMSVERVVPVQLLTETMNIQTRLCSKVTTSSVLHSSTKKCYMLLITLTPCPVQRVPSCTKTRAVKTAAGTSADHTRELRRLS